jgi:hypothetical protein
MFVTRLFGRSWLGVRDKLVGVKTCSTKRVVFGNYSELTDVWSFSSLQKKIILKDVILYLLV